MKESYPLSIAEFSDFEGNTISAGSAEAQAAEKLARENDRGHVFHSWSAQAKINPLPIAHASGSWFYDYDGKGYLDSSSQLVSANLGHNHPQLVEAIESQLRRVTNVNPAFASDVRGALAEDLVKKAQGDFSHVFFTNGGADAVEHAIRMARKHTGKAKVLTASAVTTVPPVPRSWPRVKLAAMEIPPPMAISNTSGDLSSTAPRSTPPQRPKSASVHCSTSRTRLTSSLT